MPTTALAVVTELFRDWAGPLAQPALDVIYWYFDEIPRHTDPVRVAEAEEVASADSSQPRPTAAVTPLDGSTIGE